MPPPYLLHPVAVHFPIVLLTIGCLLGLWSRFKPPSHWAATIAARALWMGTAAAWIAMGLGLLAKRTAPHVPLAWQTLNAHRTSAYWTVGLFTLLSIWRWRLGGRWERVFLILWLAACGALLRTADYGGDLVFTYGMGVKTE